MGQTDYRVSFLARGRDYTLFLTSSEAVLNLMKPRLVRGQRGLHPASLASRRLWTQPFTQTQGTVLRLRYVGANATPQAIGLNPLPGLANYLVGADPHAWHTDIPTYRQVAYHNIYPGVDLVYYGNQGRLEYDFEVAPGANPQVIQLAIDGAQNIQLDAQGALLLRTTDGTIVQRPPVVYQMVAGQRHLIPAQYTLTADKRIGFAVGAYDPQRPLVIDPVLSYSTYLGGSGQDQAAGIAVDQAGNVYVTGSTASVTFPTTTGAYSTTSGGGSHVFVTKLNGTGSALVYSTYIGGEGSDSGNAIAVDAAGHAYIAGSTTSTLFPIVNAVQSSYGGNGDAFVAELNSTGSALVYSTYLGGNQGDTALGIALDGMGGTYVTGYTYSASTSPPSFPHTTIFGTTGYSAVFVTKLAPGGSGLSYSALLGGDYDPHSDEQGDGIAVDSAGQAYVVGFASTNFPTTANAFAPSPSYGGYQDAFVTKLNAAGSGLLYSTYLGGSGTDSGDGGNGQDYGQAITVDNAGNAYVTGYTNSDSFPTVHPVQGTFNSYGDYHTDAFVAKLNTTLSGAASLVYSTYLGGTYNLNSGDDYGRGIAIDSAGDAYVTGDTTSDRSFPLVNAVQNSYVPVYNGPFADVWGHAFVTEINAAGTAWVYSTYLGGSQDDVGTAIAVDTAGSAYVAGWTASNDFPTTTGSYSQTNAGSYDAFVAKLSPTLARGTSGTIPWHPHHTVRLSGFPSDLIASVDLADGHVDLTANDMSLPARGPDLELSHTWDSTLAQAGITTTAGQGWLDSLSPSIGGAITGTLSYTDGSGAVWSFPYVGPLTATTPYTAYQTPPGLPISLTVSTVPTTVYTLTNILTGASRVFNASGAYSSDVDAYGNANTLSPGPSGPISDTNSGGRALSFSYSGGLLNDATSYNWLKGGGSGLHETYGYSGTQLVTQTWGAGTGDAITATYGYSGTQLTSVTTPAGHQWLLGYDNAGRLSNISSPAQGVTPAYTTTISYSAGQTVVVQGAGSAQSLTTMYGLDVQGEAITITDGLDHHSSAVYDADHNITSATDANQNTTSYYYAYVGPAGAGNPDGLGSVGLVTETVQPAIRAYTFTNGLSPVVTQYYYNASNDLTAVVGPESDATTLYGYDGHHSVMTTTQLLTATANTFCPQAVRLHPGVSASAPLPVAGQAALSPLSGSTALTGEASPSSIASSGPVPNDACRYNFGWRATVNGYDQYGELVSQTDGRGVSAPSTTSADPAPLDTPPTVTLAANANQYTHHWSYRTLGDLMTASTPPITTISGTISSTGPVTTSYGYTYDGLRTVTTEPGGGTTSIAYNHLGQATKVYQSSVRLYNGGTGAPSVSYLYDGDGNLIVAQDVLNNASTYSYDPLGRLQYAINPVGGTTIYTYTATTLAQMRDPAWNVTTYGYDAAGRLTSQSDPASPSFQTQYGLDEAGNTTAITTPLDYANPAAASVAAYGYDALNEPVSVTVGGVNEVTQTVAQTSLSSYDHAGQVVQVQAPNGDVTYSQYDLAGRHTESDLYPSAVSGPASPAPPASQFYSFDLADNLSEQLDFTLYDHRFGYDAANRLLQQQDCLLSCTTQPAITTIPAYNLDGATVALTRTEPGGALSTSTASYNALDWLTSQSDAVGSGSGSGMSDTSPFTTTYGYDHMGRLRTQSLLGSSASGVLTATLNGAGWITGLSDTITDTSPTTSTTSTTSLFTYTADAQPTAVTLDKGSGQLQETRQYDPDNRLTQLHVAGPTGVSSPVNSTYVYTYSPQGRTTAITSPSDFSSSQIAYDALGRLRASSGFAWSYDGNGNLVSETSPTLLTTYHYANTDGSEPAGWLPNEVVSVSNALNTTVYGYDASGNTTAITSSEPMTLAYNAAGRLSSVGSPYYGGTVVSIAYNARGWRAAFTQSAGSGYAPQSFSERLAYRGKRVGQVVVTGTSSFTETFLYRPDGSPLELLRQVAGQPTQRYWYVLDGQGNVVALVDSTGSVVDTYDYDLWGTLALATNETVPQPLRYRGYWFDGWYNGNASGNNNGLLAWYWLGAREYDPALRRFLQPDPSAQDGVRSYAYATDDPVDRTDASGLLDEPIENGGQQAEPLGPLEAGVSSGAAQGGAEIGGEVMTNVGQGLDATTQSDADLVQLDFFAQVGAASADQLSNHGDTEVSTGETAYTRTGKAIHKALADLRRATGTYDLVNSPITDAEGNPINVPYEVDLKTGLPKPGTEYQEAAPDAVSFTREVIVDDKPVGRNIARDRQEMIRFISAYRTRMGALPQAIEINRYDPTTGEIVGVDVYTPARFLPRNAGG